MPMSTDVNLPRGYEPKFPNRCVVCGNASPGSSTTLSTSTLSWLVAIFWWWGRRVKVTAPACKKCGSKLRSYRHTSTLVTALITILVLTTIWPAIEANVPLGLRKWAIMGIVFAFCIPYFLFDVFWPVAFDITAYENSIDYEFRESDYAIEFAILNTEVEWVKLEGELMPAFHDPNRDGQKFDDPDATDVER